MVAGSLGKNPGEITETGANCETGEDTRGPLAVSWDGLCGHLKLPVRP